MKRKSLVQIPHSPLVWTCKIKNKKNPMFIGSLFIVNNKCHMRGIKSCQPLLVTLTPIGNFSLKKSYINCPMFFFFFGKVYIHPFKLPYN
jgi:hypothetical protein